MEYQTMTIEDIINWCKENNQVSWLKVKAAQTVPYKVYPRKKIKDENGKTKVVADKSVEPKVEKRPISFIQIKKDFVDAFMPEIAPKAAEKKKTMYDLIAEL